MAFPPTPPVSPPPTLARSDTSTGAFVPGNGGSLDKCRRRWDLADSENLKYKFMNAFDRAMQHLDKVSSGRGARGAGQARGQGRAGMEEPAGP